MVDLSRVTPEQEFIVARHSRMVGKVLDLIEASLFANFIKFKLRIDGIKKLKVPKKKLQCN